MNKAAKSSLRGILHSFRFRLTLLFVGILAFILAGFSLFIYLRQVQVLRAETAARLSAQTAQFSTYYRSLPRRPSEEEIEEEDRFGIPQENFLFLQEHEHFALIGPNGQLIQKSEHFSTSDLSAIQAAWSQDAAPQSHYQLAIHEEEDSPETHDYLFMVTPIELEHEIWAVLILGSQIDPSGQLPRLALTLALVFGSTLLLAFAGGFWLADRAMKPVQTITRTASDIGEHDLSHRLNLDRSDEIGELAATFDRMLARLQAAFERQRQFTTDASHEFRTPLTIIELETNRALEKNRSSADYRKALRMIQSENELLSRMVEGLLTLARMDSGRAVFKSERLDLADVVLEVAGRLSRLAENKGVTMVLDSLEEEVVLADRTYLAQLLTNLVENAIKYAAGTAPTVTLESGDQKIEGRLWAWATVADNGPGIPVEHLPHLFDRFYRVDEARGREESSASNGSGLGLAIADSIAGALGGRLEVTSEIGKGTVFKVWLPGA